MMGFFISLFHIIFCFNFPDLGGGDVYKFCLGSYSRWREHQLLLDTFIRQKEKEGDFVDVSNPPPPVEFSNSKWLPFSFVRCSKSVSVSCSSNGDNGETRVWMARWKNKKKKSQDQSFFFFFVQGTDDRRSFVVTFDSTTLTLHSHLVFFILT
jgi:hypothetical protein